MSNDPEQEYFSDGITEELTSTLAQLSSLFVIARNSAFTYKGKAVKIQDVGRELGVRYVVEGSVRKVNNRVRVTAQLIEAATGGHLWAQTYDRELQDIFAVQDEVTQKIMFALKVTLTPEEQTRFRQTSTHDLEAYDYYLRGKDQYLRFTKEAHSQARQLLEQAIAIDPQYAEAYASLALVHWQAWVWQWNPDPRGLDWAFDAARRAVALNDSLAIAHALLGHFYLFKKQHDQAIAEGEQAILLDPNDAESYAWLGQILNFSGRPEETVRLMETAMRLNPHYPEYYPSILGYAYRLLGRYEEAVAAQQSALARNPDFLAGHSVLAVLYSELGQQEEARAQVREVLRISPQFSLKAYGQKLPFKDPADLKRYLAALRKAGLK
jgi:TolB-like protein/Flp pilus assembly protein TadD